MMQRLENRPCSWCGGVVLEEDRRHALHALHAICAQERDTATDWYPVWWRGEHGQFPESKYYNHDEDTLRLISALLKGKRKPECQGDLAVLAVPARLVNYDWDEVFKYAAKPLPTVGSEVSLDGFERADVKRVVAIVDGENEGPEWIGVFELHDGRFAVLRAGCDYTGWG